MDRPIRYPPAIMRSRASPTPLQQTESFLVRRWRGDQGGWRYALQQIPDGPWQGFANAADLLTYLTRSGAPPADEARAAKADDG